jgi:hypothetical protein
VLEGKYVVEFIRYGVRHYYPATDIDEVNRFIALQEKLGEATVQRVTTPNGTPLPIA